MTAISPLTAAVLTDAQGGLYLDLLKRALTGYVCPESSYIEIRPRRSMSFFRKLMVRGLLNRGYKLYKVQSFDPEARGVGKDWPSFCCTMIGLRRLDNLQFCVETVLHDEIPGDIMETGVWRGGACIFARAVLKAHGVSDRSVVLADSFEGLPTPSVEADRGYDLSEESYLAVSLDEVKAGFERFGLLDDRVKFLKGWFKDTLPGADVHEVAVLRLDGDLYESTMDVLNSMYRKVAAGGFVIIDDFHSWPPCKLAVTDFRTRMNIVDPIVEIDGSAVFWRKSSQRHCPR